MNPQIQIARVLCILCMIWVHVPPGVAGPSIVGPGGNMHAVGYLLSDVLARSSVAALSLISGVLLWQTARSKALTTVGGQKFRTLIVPMAAWGAIYVLMAVAKERVVGGEVAGLDGVFASPMSQIDAIFGLTDSTANYALFFLRDLFVSLVLLRLILPLLPRFGIPLLGLMTVLTLGGLTDPVLFRPSILLFALFGAWWSARGFGLADLERGPWLLVAFLCGALHTVIEMMGTDVPLIAALSELAMRVALAVVMLWVTGRLARTGAAGRIARLGRFTFLAYLAHIPLNGMTWVIWQKVVGSATEPSYLLFYVFNPILALACAAAIYQLLRIMPGAVQIALAGKRIGTARPVAQPRADQAA